MHDDAALQATIERNRGVDVAPPRGWLPHAGPGCPPELAAYLEARRAYLAATAEMTTAELDLHDLLEKRGGRLDHGGYRYERGKVGGVTIRQL